MNSPDQVVRRRRSLLLGSAAVIAASGLACATAGQKAAESEAALSGPVMNVKYKMKDGACVDKELDPPKKAYQGDRVQLKMHNQCTDSVDVTVVFDKEFSCDAPSNPYSFTLAPVTNGPDSMKSFDCSLDYDLTKDGDYDIVLNERTIREASPTENVMRASEIALEAVP